MPTSNKRINLTIPAVLYEKIAAYRAENGIISDASACVQLIQAQLRNLESSKIMMEAMRKLSPEQLEQISKEGLDALRKGDL